MNNWSANIKLSKTWLTKIVPSGGFLGRILRPLLKTDLPLIKNILKPLGKSVLIPLSLRAVASAADGRTRKKISGNGEEALIISNEEMDDIMNS